MTGSYFHVLGIGAFAGRVITDADDSQSAPPTAVMSYRTWQQSYGSDPNSDRIDVSSSKGNR